MNKGIVWLASYPKSGNTYLRIFLSHYLFSNNDKIDFNNLEKIPKFESRDTFSKVIDFNNSQNFIYYKHCIEVQEKLIKKLKQNDLLFKTHHFYGNLNGYNFTNIKNTKAFVYLVRDPREIVVSYASHSDISIKAQLKMFLLNNEINRDGYETKVNWSLSYKSWRSFKGVPSIFVKFEDLIDDPINSFSSIVFFLSNFIDIKFDPERIKNIVSLIEFKNLQKEELIKGFNESISNKKFFKSGKKDTWKKILNKNQINKIENHFSETMKDLNYL